MHIISDGIKNFRTLISFLPPLMLAASYSRLEIRIKKMLNIIVIFKTEKKRWRTKL